jgi:hypothetical protein
MAAPTVRRSRFLCCKSERGQEVCEVCGPARQTTAGLDRLASAHRNQAELVSFWMNLKEGYDFFESHYQPPVVRVDGGRRYAFTAK